MALIKCSECQKEVSDKAYTCPNCGCPIATKVGDGTVKIKLPRTEQMADGWVGLFSSKDAAHDLEDGLRVKAYIIDEILHEYHSRYGDSESYKKLVELVDDAKLKSGFGNNKIDSTEYCKLFRQELSSSIIFTLISDIGLVEIDDEYSKKTGTVNDKELGFINYKELADGLKEITFRCINHNNDVYYYEQRGLSVLEYLSKFYTSHTHFLPPEYVSIYNFPIRKTLCNVLIPLHLVFES